VVRIVPQQQQFPSGQVESVPPLTTNQQAPSPPAVTPRSNQPPVSKDVSGEVSPEGSTEIMLDATDADSNNLTAIIVKGPDCGSQTLNQQIGSLLYTAKSVQDITNSQCTGDSLNGWLDTITYKVSDGESDSNVATVRIKIKPSTLPSSPPPVTPSNQANQGPEIVPKVKIIGPKSAGPGENVTLIGNLTGLNATQISSAQFIQEQGTNLSYSVCNPGAQCAFPSISFVMPSCPTNDKIFKFTLSVPKNNSTKYTDNHTVKLTCQNN
jgi:Big-like domain-containing protein